MEDPDQSVVSLPATVDSPRPQSGRWGLAGAGRRVWCGSRWIGVVSSRRGAEPLRAWVDAARVRGQTDRGVLWLILVPRAIAGA